MRWRIPLVAVLALFVAVSCDQQPVEPPADQAAEAPAFNFSNGPNEPGNSGVFRWEEDSRWYFIVTDYKTGLMAQASNDPGGYCGPLVAPIPFDFQENASGFNWLLTGSDWYAWVYDPTGFGGDFCAFFAVTEPIATGPVDFNTHLGQADDYKAEGWVDMTDGSGMAHLQMHLGLQWEPVFPYDFLRYRVLKVHLSNPRD